jgi:2-polyprenyl-3-methyl-5-hydroxy-6-metoxy-1,4-benzoquinol methylase
MKWIAHQIRLPDSSATLDHQEGHSERVLRHIQLVSDLLHKPFGQARVLDLACLEGGFTFELAMQGAQAVGLEGREENLEKCAAAKSRLGLSNCTFLQEDVRNLSKAKHGEFDIVLCLGILYHLTASDGVEFLKRIFDVCQGAVIIDTHIALFGEEEVTLGGAQYRGRTYREFAPRTAAGHKLAALASSLDNENSFWMTEESLSRCLQEIGFTSVLKAVVPPIPRNVNDRATLVALKGIPVKLRSCDMPLETFVSERPNPSVLLASFTDKQLISFYRDRTTSSELSIIEHSRNETADANVTIQQLRNQLAATTKTLDSVLNSTGWKLLNRYRKLRNYVRPGRSSRV